MDYLTPLRKGPRAIAEHLADLAPERTIFAYSHLGLNDRRVYELLQQAASLFTGFAVAVERALPPLIPGDPS